MINFEKQIELKFITQKRMLSIHIIHYPSSITLTYGLSFGSLVGLNLVIKMIFGIFLSMRYTPLRSIWFLVV